MPIRKHTIILLGIFFSSLQLYAQASVELKMSADTLKNSFGPLLKPNLSDSLINYGKLYLNNFTAIFKTDEFSIQLDIFY